MVTWEIVSFWWPVVVAGISIVAVFNLLAILYGLVLFLNLFGQFVTSLFKGKLLATLDWWLQLLACRFSNAITFVLNLSLVLLILLVLSSSLAFLNEWLLGGKQPVPFTALTFSLAIVDPSNVELRGFPAVQLLRSAIWLFAVLGAIALWLYLRFGCGADARFTNPADHLWRIPEDNLLPSQIITFREMQDRISSFSLQQESLVIALEGDWGTGKSYVTGALDLAHKPREWKIYHRAMGLLAHPLSNWPQAMDVVTSGPHKSDDEQVRDNLSSVEPSVDPQSNPRRSWRVDLAQFNSVMGKLLDPDDARSYFLYPSERTIGDSRSGQNSTFRHGHREGIRSRGGKRPDRVIFIKTDAWRFTSEAELHWGLLEALLTHPHVPPRFRFLIRTTNLFRYPFVVLPVYLIRACQCIFRRGQVTLPGGAGFSFAMSGLLWQGQLEAAIDKIRDDGGIVVWCLDEIDRSSSDMAQAAITMIRRYLSFPGVITIVPYVKSQLHFKVFNPLQPTRPDLEATIFSVLWEDWIRKGFDSARVESPAEQLGLKVTGNQAKTEVEKSSHGMASVIEPFSPRGLLPKELESLSPELLAAISATEPSGSIQRLAKAHLIRYYLDRNSAEFRELRFLFEEKYLRQAHITLKRMQPADVGGMLILFEELRFPIERLIRGKLSPQNPEEMNTEVLQGLMNLIKKSVTDVITKVHEQFWPISERPVLRHLVDEVRQKLVGLFNFDALSEIVELLPLAMVDGRAFSLLAAYLDREKSFANVQQEMAELNHGDALDRTTQGQVFNEHVAIVMMIVFVVLVAYRRASLRLDPIDGN